MHVTLREVHNIQNPTKPQRYISQALTPLPRKDVGPTIHIVKQYLFFTAHAFTWYSAFYMRILRFVRYRLLLFSRLKTVFKSGIDKLYYSGHM